jgi:hypothetical protein
VLRLATGDHHLSGPCIAAGIWLPTLPGTSEMIVNGPLTFHWPQSKLRSREPGIYVAFQHARFTRPANYLPGPWALTPRFQPHPKAVIFCGTLCWRYSRHPALNRCIALCCPDFPHPPFGGSDDPVGSPAKVVKRGYLPSRTSVYL